MASVDSIDESFSSYILEAGSPRSKHPKSYKKNDACGGRKNSFTLLSADSSEIKNIVSKKQRNNLKTCGISSDADGLRLALKKLSEENRKLKKMEEKSLQETCTLSETIANLKSKLNRTCGEDYKTESGRCRRDSRVRGAKPGGCSGSCSDMRQCCQDNLAKMDTMIDRDIKGHECLMEMQTEQKEKCAEIKRLNKECEVLSLKAGDVEMTIGQLYQSIKAKDKIQNYQKEIITSLESDCTKRGIKFKKFVFEEAPDEKVPPPRSTAEQTNSKKKRFCGCCG